MNLQQLSNLPGAERKAALYRCCGSTTWVNTMSSFFPFEDLISLMETGEEQWYKCTAADWKEAFSQHPAIGNPDSLHKKFADTEQWASNEQASVKASPPEVLADIARANQEYQEKFEYIFIVSATGKSANELLQILQQRLLNPPEVEIKIAAEEQNKITLLRLQKLLS